MEFKNFEYSDLFRKLFLHHSWLFSGKFECANSCTDVRTSRRCIVHLRRATEDQIRYHDSIDHEVEIKKAFKHPCIGDLNNIILDRKDGILMYVSEECIVHPRLPLSTFVRLNNLKDRKYQAIIWDVLARFESLVSALQENNQYFARLSPSKIAIEVKNGKIEFLKLPRPYLKPSWNRKSQLPYKNFPAKPCHVDLAALAYFCFTGKKFFHCCKNIDELDVALRVVTDPEQSRYIRRHVRGEDKDSAASECSSSYSFVKCDADQVVDERSDDDKVSNVTMDQLSEADNHYSNGYTNMVEESGIANYIPDDYLIVKEIRVPVSDDEPHQQEICEKPADVRAKEDRYSHENIFGKFKTLAADDKDFRLGEIPNLDIACKLKLELDIPSRNIEYHKDVILVKSDAYPGNAFKYEGNRITGISWGKKTVPDALDEITRANLIMLAAAVELATSQPCLILNDAFGYDGLTITVQYNKRTLLKHGWDTAIVVNDSILERSTMEKDFVEKMHRAAMSIYEVMLKCGTVPKASKNIDFKDEIPDSHKHW